MLGIFMSRPNNPFECQPPEVGGGEALMPRPADWWLCLVFVDWGRCITMTGSLTVPSCVLLDFISWIAIFAWVTGTGKGDDEADDGVEVGPNHLFSMVAAAAAAAAAAAVIGLTMGCS